MTDAQPVPQPLPEDAVQLLAPDGTFASSGHAERFAPYAERITSDVQREMYRQMAVTRAVDAEGERLQRQGKLLIWVPSLGQEGAQAGAVSALEQRDWIFPTYREHLMALARGVQPEEFMRWFRGTAHIGWRPQDYRMQHYTLVLASQTLHATGYAWGVKLDQKGWDETRLAAEGEVVLACFGDGASSQGEVHESMVFASSVNAPVVFFCQNNHWAISVPFDVQSRVPLAQRAAGYGFEGLTVDGNDPLASFAVTAYAAEQTRLGNGPVLVEAHTYRQGAHTTADDPTKYRTSDEEQAWSGLDPLVRLRTHLENTEVTDQQFFDDVETEAADMAADLRATAHSDDHPGDIDLNEVFDTVYAAEHSLVAEEKAWHNEWQAGFADHVPETSTAPAATEAAGGTR